MAESLNTAVKRRAIRGTIWGLLLAVATGAMAENLSDPTRPPLSGGFAGMQKGGNVPTSAGGPILQSVFISGGKRTAIISGEAVSLGGNFAGSKVVKITESEVVLRNGSSVQTLKLFPDLEKQPSFRASGKTNIQRQ